MEYKKEIVEIILDIIEMEEDEIGPDEEFASFDHIDSLGALDILTALERKYKTKIPETELRNFLTINKIIEVVERSVPELTSAA
jgi:acyl carrier protein